MTLDPFVIFVIALTVLIGAGGLYIDRYGRKPRSDERARHSH